MIFDSEENENSNEYLNKENFFGDETVNIHEYEYIEKEEEKEEEEEDIFYIPYKYIIEDNEDENFFNTIIYMRSSNGKNKRAIINKEHESFLLLNEIPENKRNIVSLQLYTIKHLKEFFSTDKIEYLEKNNCFVITPFSNVSKDYYENNKNRIIKIEKNVSNILKYYMSDRDFFNPITTNNSEANISLKENEVKYHFFKTVVWSMINRDTLIFIYINSNHNNNQNPYCKVNIWTSNFRIITQYINDEINFNSLLNDFKEKENIEIELKPIISKENKNENRIFFDHIPIFLEFIENEIDICINYGEIENNSYSKYIFNKLEKINSIQNINIKDFFKNIYSHIDDHSIFKIIKLFDFKSELEEENNVNESLKNLINLDDETQYQEEGFLISHLTFNERMIMKNIYSFFKNISSYIIIITKLWISCSSDIFNISIISNTNFNNIIKNNDEIIKGIITKNYNIFTSLTSDFTHLSKVNKNFFKPNFYNEKDQFIVCYESVKLFLNYLKENNNLNDFELFFYNFFNEKSFLQSLHWIFYRFFDIFDILNNNSKRIKESIYKNFFENIFKENYIGFYKGCIYKSSKIIEEGALTIWGSLLVLENGREWIGIRSSEDKKIFGYFGDSVVCKHSFQALKNYIEFHFSLFISGGPLGTKDIMKKTFNLENTRMLKNLDTFNKSFFNLNNIEQEEFIKGDIINKGLIVWYNKDEKYTLNECEKDFDVYIKLCENIFEKNIINCIEEYKKKEVKNINVINTTIKTPQRNQFQKYRKEE